jgi:hypothetical protein
MAENASDSSFHCIILKVDRRIWKPKSLNLCRSASKSPLAPLRVAIKACTVRCSKQSSTSRVSFLESDTLPAYCAGRPQKYSFSGRRTNIARGGFTRELCGTGKSCHLPRPTQAPIPPTRPERWAKSDIRTAKMKYSINPPLCQALES